MDKKTIIAIVISVVIIIGAFAVNSLFFAPKPADPIQIAEELGLVDKGTEKEEEVARIVPLAEEGEAALERSVSFKTNVFEGKFSTRGGTITSLSLRRFTEVDGSMVEMVVSGDSGEYPFNIILDDYDTADDIFTFTPSMLGDEFSFSRKYLYRQNGRQIPFTLKKTYVFKDDEYLFEHRVAMEVDASQNLPVQEYTLLCGPQIGPPFEKLDGRTEYRRYIYYADGKRKDYTRQMKNVRKDIEDWTTWHAIEGHYFLSIGVSYISDRSKLKAGFDSTAMDGLPANVQSSLYFDRTIDGGVRVDDGYKFYVGPKKRDILARYSDREQNAWEESGLNLENAVRSDFWGWLSAALKWLLELFYKLIPNWGVAIILLTIVIKIIFFPLKRKSYESTKKMAALAPKIEEIKKRHEGNQQKINQEMQELYKRERVNPISGCLPLLIQLPIFFALYSLFSNFFEFRGAAFISPWIADLSAPERVLTLPFSIPFLGAELRLLPFVMVASSYLQQKTMQTPGGGQTSRNSKIMMYAMPAFFFFIMYNMPSGLLIYWTMQGLLEFITQLYVNKHKPRKRKSRGDKK